MRLANLRQSLKMSRTERFYINCAGFINNIMKQSHKDDDGPHSHQKKDQQGQGHVLAARTLLQLVGFAYVLPRRVDVPVGVEDLLADDVQLLPLLVHQHSRLLHYVVHVHDTVGHDVYLVVALLHQLTLHLELHLHLLLTLAVVVGRLALLVREAAPGRHVAARRLGVDDGLHGGHFPVLPLLGILGRWGLFILCGGEQLVPPIPLYSKLLLGRADLPGRIGVKVGLLEPLNEFFDLGGGIFNDGLLSFETRDDDGAGVDPDGPVEVVVAVLQLFYEGDRLLVGGGELSSHLYLYSKSI